MSLLVTILLLFAFVLVTGSPRVRLGWLGVAAAFLVLLITHWPK